MNAPQTVMPEHLRIGACTCCGESCAPYQNITHIHEGAKVRLPAKDECEIIRVSIEKMHNEAPLKFMKCERPDETQFVARLYAERIKTNMREFAYMLTDHVDTFSSELWIEKPWDLSCL